MAAPATSYRGLLEERPADVPLVQPPSDHTGQLSRAQMKFVDAALNIHYAWQLSGPVWTGAVRIPQMRMRFHLVHFLKRLLVSVPGPSAHQNNLVIIARRLLVNATSLRWWRFSSSQVMDTGSVTWSGPALAGVARVKNQPAAPLPLAHLASHHPQFITARSYLANEVKSKTGTIEGKLFQRG